MRLHGRMVQINPAGGRGALYRALQEGQLGLLRGVGPYRALRTRKGACMGH